ncbi:GNAT family N-acetyltransferase [Novosphingopyxis sp.]|uniref:GNAT family N-acetyltransferase n=1 Tax=Novosphingopyxis sp. TaxID=2709690 RepID=UPI003B5BC55D
MNQIVFPTAFDGALRHPASFFGAERSERIEATAIDVALLHSWQALDGRSGEANIFDESRVLPAALAHCDPRGMAELFLLWEGAPRASQLIGLMPLSLERRYGARPLPHWQNWLHPNAFLGNPLIAPGRERVFWQALLAELDIAPGAGLFFHLNGVALGGPVAEALLSVCADERRRCDVVCRHQRAFLRSDLTAKAYYEQAVRPKKRKELRRQKRRLEELGRLDFERSDGSQGLEEWIDAFLALEAAGWKGQGQSALGSQDSTRALFHDMLGAMARDGRLELLSFSFESAPIAMLVNLRSGDGVFSFKTAFDESFARFSPGVLLQIENYALLDRPGFGWADSCAAPDHPMIDSLWTERRAIGRVSVAIGGAARRLAFAGLRKAEDWMAARGGDRA